MSAGPTVEEAEAFLGSLAESFLASSADFFSTLAVSQKGTINSGGPDYEARYKALIEHIPGVIFVAPLHFGDGNAYVSPQIETILGFTQEEWLEDPLRWYQQVHPEDKERWSIEAASLFLSAQPLSSNYRVIARDGRVIWFQCDARMVHSSDGKPAFIHGVGFDVTQLKEAEASLLKARNELETRVAERTETLARTNAQLSREIAEHKRTELLLIAAKEAAEASARIKREFMANMSHEIRTPMNGVLGLTGLVLNTELTTGQRKNLLLAQNSAESLLTIINQVLDFSKLESGKAKLHLSSFDLRSSMEAVTGGLRLQAETKGLDFAHHISLDTPDHLVGDVGRLGQILTNLIGNAIRFTRTGHVNLLITPDHRVTPKGNEECALLFSVVDTGVGITSATIGAIFEPFVQANGSLTREYGGTGLGLAIAKELAAMMGGTIDVISIPGSGSTFSFTITFGIAIDQIKAQAPADSPRGAGPLRVLVAEDNLVNQMVVTGVLEACGHTVTMAENGLEAVDAYKNSSFDIILMDVQMPLMDGMQATVAIREIEAERGQQRIPILGLSAHAVEANRGKSLRAGMDGYISKPFKGAELILLMGKLTSRFPA